jgi:hypothetical protein
VNSSWTSTWQLHTAKIGYFTRNADIFCNIGVHLARLNQRNANAFMFVDEPGLQFLFSSMSGYGDLKAKGDLDQFSVLVCAGAKTKTPA